LPVKEIKVKGRTIAGLLDNIALSFDKNNN